MRRKTNFLRFLASFPLHQYGFFFENSVTGLSQHERGAVAKEVGSDKPFYRLLCPVPFASAAI